MAERFDFEAVIHTTNGRTRAPVVRFVDRATGHRTDLLVKSVGRHLTERGLCCEYFGNVLAREMGLHTPQPHILEIDAATAAAMNTDSTIRGAGVTIPSGVAIGSEWFRPAALPGTTARLSGPALEDAARIYAHDLIMQQPDRTAANPNILEVRGRFVAIDFETSCSFLYAIGVTAPPWRVSALPFARNHFFRLRLTVDSVNWRTIVATMISFDIDRFRSALSNLPASWHGDCATILSHIEAVKSRETDLVWEIISSVS